MKLLISCLLWSAKSICRVPGAYRRKKIIRRWTRKFLKESATAEKLPSRYKKLSMTRRINSSKYLLKRPRLFESFGEEIYLKAEKHFL